MSSIMPLGVWVGAASKQTSTMLDVAVGWLCSLLGTLGGNFGWDILYLGVAGLNTPIWDVLAPEGEQEEALNCLRMGSISLSFSIRQAVPLGLAQAWFFIEKQMYYSRYNTYISILHIYNSSRRWARVDGFG